jgi:hypothetical protein
VEQARQIIRIWAIRISVIVAVLLSVLLVLYLIHLWSGKSVWAVLEVLAVPITVGAAVPFLNWLQKKRELEVEDQRAQDEALQAYLNQMSQLLIKTDTNPRGAETENASDTPAVKLDNAARAVARTWTLTVLETLDSGRDKRRVLRFLYEANLIGKKEEGGEEEDFAAVVNLSRASLVDADLSGGNLRGVDLRGADLVEAILTGTDLRDANLRHARTRDKKKDKKVTTLVDLDNVALAKKGPALEGATMPNGQIYEEWIDWLKEKECCEDLTSDEKDYLDQLKKGEMNNEPS